MCFFYCIILFISQLIDTNILVPDKLGLVSVYCIRLITPHQMPFNTILHHL